MTGVRKAIIPAAGRGTRQIPASFAVRKELFPFQGPDGIMRPAIHYLVEEAQSAGATEICIVTEPEGDQSFRQYFEGPQGSERDGLQNKPAARAELARLERMLPCIRYATQDEQRGLGHAIWCAREFAADEPCLVLLGDHVFVSLEARSCAMQLVDSWQKLQTSASCVFAVPESALPLYGIIQSTDIQSPWKVSRIVEKPDVEFARQHLRCGPKSERPYLAFFGMHVAGADVFDALDHLVRSDVRERGEIQLTTAQSLAAERGSYHAMEVAGLTLDFGIPAGMAYTNAVLNALGPFAAEIQHRLVEDLGRR